MNVLRAYWPSMKKHWILGCVVIISMIISVYLSATPQYYVKEIVNIYTSTQKPNTEKAYLLLWSMGWCYLWMQASYRVFNFSMTYLQAKVMRELDKQSMAFIQRQSLRFFEDTFSGSLVQCASRFKNSFKNIVDLVMYNVGRDFVILCIVITIFARNLPSFAMVFALWAIIFLGFSIAAAYVKFPLDVADAAADSAVSGSFADSTSCHFTVKLFGNERLEQERINSVIDYNYKTRIRCWNSSNIIIGIQGALMAFGEFGLIWWMIIEWNKGRITAGDFVFFQLYVIWIMDHLWSFGNAYRQIMHSIAQAQEMSNIIASSPEVQDSAGARPLTVRKGEITLDHVCFQYPGLKEGELTIRDVSLLITAGESIGLVGKTGSGKSTFVRLILRLSDLNSGSILIDNQDVSMVTQVSLRQQIAVVSQPPQMFHRTIRENIGFGNSDAQEEDIIAAAKAAHAWEFIQKLPQGLDTLVGERGVKLSGGQAQRIAIARAMITDPKIVIFDEATSALDSETESLIQDAMTNLFKGKTCIVIAHRLSTIRRMNRILVIEEGVIVEQGTHDSLRQIIGGHYANLWNRQTERFIAE